MRLHNPTKIKILWNLLKRGHFLHGFKNQTGPVSLTGDRYLIRSDSLKKREIKKK